MLPTLVSLALGLMLHLSWRSRRATSTRAGRRATSTTSSGMYARAKGSGASNTPMASSRRFSSRRVLGDRLRRLPATGITLTPTTSALTSRGSSVTLTPVVPQVGPSAGGAEEETHP